MHYALRGNCYPIETSTQIKIAADYFTSNIARFSPSDRVEIATNLEKRAEELNCDCDIPWITNYSRMMKKEASYSPEFERNMKNRRDICNAYDVDVKVGGNIVKAASLVEKLISEKNETEPLQMVAAIAEFDKMANLESHYDTRIMDSVFTVFGSDANPDFDMVKTACDTKKLKKAAKNKKFIEKMSSMMGNSFADDFAKSPVDIFNSMPTPEQQLIIEKMSEIE